MSKVYLETYDVIKHGDLLTYQLQDDTFTAHPKDAIKNCQGDHSRYPVVILSKGQLWVTLSYTIKVVRKVMGMLVRSGD